MEIARLVPLLTIVTLVATAADMLRENRKHRRAIEQLPAALDRKSPQPRDPNE